MAGNADTFCGRIALGVAVARLNGMPTKDNRLGESAEAFSKLVRSFALSYHLSPHAGLLADEDFDQSGR